MRTVACAAAIVLMLLVSCGRAQALVWIYAPDAPVVRQAHWPDGLEDLLNREGRVYGYSAFASDYFFFAGKTPAFNDFLAQCAQLRDTPLTLIIHAGQGEAALPWEEGAQAIPFEWQVSVLGRNWHEDAGETEDHGAGRWVVQIDLWLGSWVELEKLAVPLNVEVKSGGEIEAFIEAHETRRQAARAGD
ncbi:MAG: hypothetical protein U9R79_07040 [Armatimonadota bacterium]|nr:hypothetical protein [Armatimonadota bacterium]